MQDSATLVASASLGDAPWGGRLPGFELSQSPLRRFVCVTSGARIRNPELFSQLRRDEAEGMAAHEIIAQRLRNFRHVAGSTLTGDTSFLVVGVLRDGTMRSGNRFRRVTGDAEFVADRSEI